MTIKTSKRRTYWLTEEITAGLRERALLLNQKGYDVHFFTSLEAFTAAAIKQRAGVIVLSDSFEDTVTQRILLSFMSLTEAQGSRLVMVRFNLTESINALAACANCRDIIPYHLDIKSFLTRFIYATAGKPMPFIQPAGQFTLNDIAALAFPARLTWVSSRHLRFECRIRPPVGATLKLKGPLATAAGVPFITLEVTETQRSHMLYRFSDATVAKWHVPAEAMANMVGALADLSKHDPGPRCRIFIAVPSPELRAQVLIHFDTPQFDIQIALQKQSIVEEPRFFTPDTVVIEDLLCLEDGGERFAAMMTNLQEQTTVVIIGKMPDFAAVQAAWPKLRVIQHARLPTTFGERVLTRYLPIRQTVREVDDKSGVNIASQHPFSRAEIVFPARLKRIHPQVAQLALTFPVSNFALCRIDSPLLRKMIGRPPYIKLTNTYQDTHPLASPFVNLVEGYLADLHPAEQALVGQGMIRMVGRSIEQISQVNGFITPQRSGGETRVAEPLTDATRPKQRADATALSTLLAEAPIDSNALLRDSLNQLPPTRTIEALDTQVVQPVATPAPATASLPSAGSSAIRRIRARRKTNSFDYTTILKALAIIVVAGAAVISAFTMLSGHVEKSGGNFSDQLEKFNAKKNAARTSE